jgi:DNA anti-recombination protein RmuC
MNEFVGIALTAFVSGAMAFIGGWLYQKKYGNAGGGNGLNQADITQTVNEALQKSTIQQSQALADSMFKLEERFSKLQLAMVTILNEESSKAQLQQNESINTLKEQFTLVRESNHHNLGKMIEEVQKQLGEGIQTMNTNNTRNFDLLNKTNAERLDGIQKEVDMRLKENLRQNLESFDKVKENLGHIQSTAQTMIKSTSSIDKLNNLFERTNSKGFGDFSERYLENLLTEQLNNEHWQKQVCPPDSVDKIDFYIEVAGKKIGIDSKFPVSKYQDVMEASGLDKAAALKTFRKTVIEMAKDISKKYIKNHFLDTLLMYIPSDGMYMEIVGDPETSEAIQKTKVTLVGPTTIFPLILLILAYERQINVNERAEDIILGLEKVSRNVTSFRDEFRKLGDKIRQAQDNYDKADRNLANVQRTVSTLEYTHGPTLDEMEPVLQEVE